MIKERSPGGLVQAPESPEIRMDVEEQYDALLKAADEMERTGLINSAEWRSLVQEASALFPMRQKG